MMSFCRCFRRRIVFPDFVWQSCCNPCCPTQSDSVLGISTNVITTTCRNSTACGCCGQVSTCGCDCGCGCGCCG